MKTRPLHLYIISNQNRVLPIPKVTVTLTLKGATQRWLSLRAPRYSLLLCFLHPQTPRRRDLCEVLTQIRREIFGLRMYSL